MHAVAWLALAQGALQAGQSLTAGEMAVFENGESAITLAAQGEVDAVFMIGSGMPHPHALHLGSYSVHTSALALARGEARIADLGRRLSAAGDLRTRVGTVPVFR